MLNPNSFSPATAEPEAQPFEQPVLTPEQPTQTPEQTLTPEISADKAREIADKATPSAIEAAKREIAENERKIAENNKALEKLRAVKARLESAQPKQPEQPAPTPEAPTPETPETAAPETPEDPPMREFDVVEEVVSEEAEKPEAAEPEAEEPATREIDPQLVAPETDSKLANWVNKMVKTIRRHPAVAAALSVVASAVVLSSCAPRSNRAETTTNNITEGIYETTPVNNNEQNQEEVTLTPEVKAAVGMQDGYDKDGMYQSQTGYRFADASIVAKLFNNDPTKMIEYTAENESEALADYLANLPKELQPRGFKNIGILDAETRLEHLPDASYDLVLQQFKDIMDQAHVRDKVINGRQNNAYIAVQGPNGQHLSASQFAKNNPGVKLTHDQVELVRCKTDEQNLKVTEFYWLDEEGNEIGTMCVKMIPVYDITGVLIGYEGCIQAVSDDDEYNPVYEGMPEVTDEEGDPDPTPAPTPEPELPAPIPIPDPEPTPIVPPTPTPTLTPEPELPTPIPIPDPEPIPIVPPTPDPTPIPVVPPSPDPTSTTEVQKDDGNARRVAGNTFDDAAEDIGSNYVTTSPTPEIQGNQGQTPEPTMPVGGGTEANFEQNAASQAQEVERVNPGDISPENYYGMDFTGYDIDFGGGESEPAPEEQVAEDYTGQIEADQAAEGYQEANAQQAAAEFGF